MGTIKGQKRKTKKGERLQPQKGGRKTTENTEQKR